MIGRKKPSTRSPTDSCLVLQPRDEEIIEAVYSYGLLTGGQIQHLVGFGCTVRRNVRLRALFDYGYLDRKFLPTLNGNARIVYVLGRSGVEVVSRRVGTDPQEVKRNLGRMKELKDMFLAHRLQVNDVRLAFTMAIKSHSDFQLDVWNHEPELPGVPLIPDGYCRYRHNGQLWSFFIELDRSTESHRRIKTKVDEYLNFGLSGLYQRHFGLKFYRVLVITLTQQRLLNLKRLVEQTTDKMFWFATLRDIISDPMFKAIWQRPNNERLFPLHGA